MRPLFAICLLITQLLIGSVVPAQQLHDIDSSRYLQVAGKPPPIRDDEKRIDDLIRQMTVEEKVGQMTQLTVQMVTKGKDQTSEIDDQKLEKAVIQYGVGSILNVFNQALTLKHWHRIISRIQEFAARTRLKVPVLYGIDSIHGANYVQGATLFPQDLGMAATWNPDLMQKSAEIAAMETRAAGIPWSFSPVLDVGRQPMWPRLWETFGEDPYLATVMGTAYVRGLEGDDVSSSKHVAACLKHYVGYSFALTGRDRTPALIPEHTLREYFLPPFAAAVKAGVSLTGNSIVGSTLTLTSGAFDVTANTLTLNNGVSVTGGSLTSAPNGTVNYNQASNGQSVLAANYGNLTFSNFNKTLPAAIIGIAGTFTPGSGVPTTTGNTIDFNGAGAQTIPAFSYNTLTISGTGRAITLASSGTIGVAGVFAPAANTYTVTGSTIDYNGGAAQNIIAFNYNNLTSSGAGTRALPNSGTVAITGTFTPGANVYSVSGSTIDFNGAGAQTIPAFNYNNLTSSNAGGRTLANAGSIGIAGVFTPGANSYTNTGSTVDFNGAPAQTIPAFNYNNLTSSNAGARTLASSGTVGIAGVFIVGTNAYTVTGSTVNFNGAGSQTIPAFNFNNLASSNTGARTLANTGTIGIASIFTPGTNVYTVTGSTVDINGAGAQNIPAFTFNNLLTSTAGTKSTGGNIGVNVNATVGAGTTLLVAAGNIFTVTGILTNNGNIQGLGTIVNNFSNGGQLSPGLSPGIFNITGTYANPGFLNIEIGGTAGPGINPNGHDQLLISGAATLGGTLNVTLTNGFTPVAGNSFILLDAGSSSGSFSTTNLPVLSPPNSWGISYDNAAGTVTLQVLSPTAARVSVSGRIMSAVGSPIRGARVNLTDGAGHMVAAISNTFGFYRFDNVIVGTSFIMNASVRGYSFAPRLVTVRDQLNNLDLKALP